MTEKAGDPPSSRPQGKLRSHAVEAKNFFLPHLKERSYVGGFLQVAAVVL
jgi:hypothetical protein